MATIAHGPAVEVGKAAILVKTEAIHIDDEDRIVNACKKNLKYQPDFIKSVNELVAAFQNTQQRLRNAQKALADEKAAHQTTKKQLATEKADHQKTKDALTKETADHQNTKDLLAKEKSNHEATKAQLAKTQTELAATKKELDQSIADHKKTKAELATAVTALAAATAEITKLKSEIDVLRSEKEKLQTELATVKKTLAKKEADLKIAEDSLVSVNQALDQTQKDFEGANDKIKEIDRARDALNVEVRRLKTELAHTQSGRFTEKDNNIKGKYYIDEVIYGGKSITKQTVIDALLTHAVNGTQFPVHNKFLGEDPMQGHKKILTITYTVDGKAPFKYMNVAEREFAKFE